jgi:hypothetical protein
MNPIRTLRQLFRTVSALDNKTRQLSSQIDDLRLLMGRGLALQASAKGILENLHDAEFKVCSQFGDDGIIQYLIRHIGFTEEEKTFIEFGVENYTEANTRFLLQNDNWRGLIFDGNPENIQSVKNENLYWRHDLTAVAAFVDRDNINALFESHGFTGKVGVLSIDIDGNDYWVWEAVKAVDPVVAIVEYNSVFGAQHAITVPYNPRFQRTPAHPSNLYWGASLGALYRLAQKKGYAFVGCNSAGNNAYFVKKERVGKLKVESVASGYVLSKFRESRDSQGNLTYLSGAQRMKAIAEMPVVDVESQRTSPLQDLSCR